jgi:hypothetical protein
MKSRKAYQRAPSQEPKISRLGHCLNGYVIELKITVIVGAEKCQRSLAAGSHKGELGV